MTGLVRKATLLCVVGVLLAGAAMAGVPNATLSTKPGQIKLTGYSNPVDNCGKATYTIRDANNTAVAGALVTLNFSACPDIRISQTVAGPGMTINCTAKTVSGTTDGLGNLDVYVVGASSDYGIPGPPARAYACVTVTAEGTPFPAINAVAFDLDGVNGAGFAADLSTLNDDFVRFQLVAPRSDYNGDGQTGAADLSLLVDFFVNCNSPLSGSPYCP
jgi:hypothetical protein